MGDSAAENGGIRQTQYESIPLATKYGWMNGNEPGPAVAYSFQDLVGQLASDFGATDANIGRGFLQRKVGDWTGEAAQAANAALDRATAAIGTHSSTGDTGSTSVADYASSFTYVKNSIPRPPDTSIGGALTSSPAIVGGAVLPVLGLGAGAAVDWVKQKMAYREDDEKANRALHAHENSTRTALASFQSAITGDAQPPSANKPPGSDPGPGSLPTVQPPGGNDHSVPGGPGQHGPGKLPGGSQPGTPGQQPPGSSDPNSKHPGAVPATPQPSSPTVPSTVPSNWTPPPRPTPVQRPDDLVPGPNDSLVPRANLPSYRPQPPMPTAPPLWPGANPRPGPVNRPIPQRTPGYPRPPVNQGESLGGGAGADAAANTERGGGLPPGMGAGVGRGAQEREHRNKTFIPDDSPFRFTDKELGVVPAVIGPDILDYFE